MGDGRAGSASGAPARRPTPWWAWAIIGVLITAGAVFVVGAVWVVGIVSRPFFPPDVRVAVWHVEGMTCVTWARAATEGGSFDTPPSAVIQVGLRPDCSDAEIDATYTALYTDTASVRDGDTLRIEYLVQRKAPEKPARPNELARSAGAQLTIDKDFDLPDPQEFASTVDDWNSVRRLVDPGAQLELLDDFGSAQVTERFVANSTAARLRELSASLPQRLADQAWKVTIPATGHTPFVPENAAPDGAVTIETRYGFPEPWLVDFGRHLNGAWHDNGTPEYVYVFRDPPGRGGYVNEVTAKVFHVAPAGTDGRLPRAPDTAAWPALTAALDAMVKTPGSKDHDFAMAFLLASRSFTTQDEHSRWPNPIGRDESLAVVSPSRCSQPTPTAPDGNAIVPSLCSYLSQRATTADGGDGGN